MTSDAAVHFPPARRAADPALTAALAVAIIAAATLAGAWFFQLVLDIRPCPLCLEQRYAHYLALPLGLLVAFAAARGAPRQVVLAGLAILALAALANAGLGAYHAGVEWKFWQGPTDCSGPVVDLGSAGTSAAAARQRQSDPLRRGAVALPRPLARRLQCADLAGDGRDRGVGHGFGQAPAGIALTLPGLCFAHPRGTRAAVILPALQCCRRRRGLRETPAPGRRPQESESAS